MRQLRIFLDEGNEVPFKAINYLTGECNYGGRVTDDWDRRTLLSLLGIVYTPATLENPEYKFSSSGLYCVSKRLGYVDYVEYIRSLPQSPNPEVFGIHENGDITRQLAETRQLFESILITQEGAQNTGGGSKSSDDIIGTVAADILSKIPPKFKIDEIMIKFPVNYNESMNTVLVQEVLG